MVELNKQALDQVFHALADQTRRAMLERLARDDLSVGELAAPLDMSLAAASKHVRVLEKAGLIDRRVRGRVHMCRLATRPLATASGWLKHYESFWEESLTRLSDLFGEVE